MKGAKHDRGKGQIIIDQQLALLVRKIFEEYATGAYTISALVKLTHKWGLTNSRGNQGYLCLSHLHSLMQNPFYYAVMRVQKTGKEYLHIHPPIISKELFDKCREVRLGWNKKTIT
ncbi:recombinase family protein [Orientia tsutsugamushi]|uniref:Uncharacterized protein n=1 Tax=Orientia tsutsugamushi TaxID=784 RepID=A0A2U3RP22_ORITS|nr:recombinase family protein [Orientia tsutsugamushi]KJV50843.1 recombinase family protein [Orientia tsutsugamushi str. Karp]KJV74862.1 recombinase family protein [Orientia tsutsugamushi str. TA763]SPP25322.1 Uncharacterised protein [Orientia tsutsugamushi]SPR14932.1 Uncharacterised protein [Orientia tsutsugamushi]